MVKDLKNRHLKASKGVGPPSEMSVEWHVLIIFVVTPVTVHSLSEGPASLSHIFVVALASLTLQEIDEAPAVTIRVIRSRVSNLCG